MHQQALENITELNVYDDIFAYPYLNCMYQHLNTIEEVGVEQYLAVMQNQYWLQIIRSITSNHCVITKVKTFV